MCRSLTSCTSKYWMRAADLDPWAAATLSLPFESKQLVIGLDGTVAMRKRSGRHEPYVAALPTQLDQILLRLGTILDQILDFIQHQPTEGRLDVSRLSPFPPGRAGLLANV